jgi:pyridoxamine 5'-phosphate oxidase
VNEAAFYNDLDLSFSKAWELLADGAAHRTRAAHTPVVASVDAAGNPHQRVMILREADATSRRLRFHTDSRSSKIAELESRKAVSVLIYDADEKIQLRLSGIATVETSSPMADVAWEESTLFARRCYMAERAPGDESDMPTSGLPARIEGKKPTEADIEPVRSNFAVILVIVDEIEFLYLANAGHRRAKWNWRDATQDWSGSWLVP